MAFSGFAGERPIGWPGAVCALAIAVTGLCAHPARAAEGRSAAQGEAYLAEDARCIAHVMTRLGMDRKDHKTKGVETLQQTLSELTAMFVLDGVDAGLPAAQSEAKRRELVAKNQQLWAAAGPEARKAIFTGDNAFCFGETFAARYADAMMAIENRVDN